MSTIPKDIEEKIEEYVKGSNQAWINPRQVDCFTATNLGGKNWKRKSKSKKKNKQALS